jgi:heptosyltransferase-3
MLPAPLPASPAAMRQWAHEPAAAVNRRRTEVFALSALDRTGSPAAPSHDARVPVPAAAGVERSAACAPSAFRPADAVDLAALRRVLVVKLRHHGDVLLASPVFSVLKNHAPHLEIDALVYDETRDMLARHPAISALHVVGREWRESGPVAQLRAEWDLLARLRARRYDLLVHLTDHRRGATLARLLRPRYAVAPNEPGKDRFWKRSFTHLYALPRGGRRHMVELNLDALRRLGVQPEADERALVLVPGREAEAKVEQLLAANGLAGRPFVHVHPTSRWLYKCWPESRFASLLDRLHDAGWPAVLTAAPSAAEMAMLGTIRGATRAPVVDLGGKLSLEELAALSARARLFIGVDSAPMHIAAAMATPVVALFGPTGEVTWGPWSRRARIVTSDAFPCRPCGRDGCGGGKLSECLATLPVEQVLRAAEELLA